MAAPTRKSDKQAPGVYRRRIGDALVTTINDGFLDINFEILRGAGLEDLQGLMRNAFRDGPPRLTVNAFVIETDRNTILVDSGGGSTTVYSMGRMPDNLRAAGFKPDDFDTVIVTHIHPDHTSGLLDKDGKPAFPRAEVIVHEDELAVGGGADVELEVVGAGVDGGLEGRHRVLGMVEVLAAMGDDLDGLRIVLRSPRGLGAGNAACEGVADQ